MEQKNYERVRDIRYWLENDPECNCGSFALGVDTWFAPYDNDDDYSADERESIIKELYDDCFSRREIMDVVLERDREEILRLCPWVEPITFDEIRPEDKVVAYRIYIRFDEYSWPLDDFDEDFHFRVRIGGFWFEKCGIEEVKLCPDQHIRNIWQSSPGLTYDSPILFFRFK
jgi:hypothetical protein